MINTNRVTKLSSLLQNESPIYFGYKTQKLLCKKIKSIEPKVDKYYFITDKYLFSSMGYILYKTLFETNNNMNKIYHLDILSGEKSKCFNELASLCEELIRLGVTKSSLLIAFGGGSVGNVVGLAASLIFRGIRFVEIPTTFIHQTDGTLSNKQAINGLNGKNHFGTYYKPEFIWTDTQYLASEPKQMFKSGLVEAIKNAFIFEQPSFLSYLEQSLVYGSYKEEEQKHALTLAVIKSKLEIIKRDPTERSLGVILEYGHTFAHAIEWLSNGKLYHGECVSIGMKLAAELSYHLSYLSKIDLDFHYTFLDDYLQIDSTLSSTINADSIIKFMTMDNKRKNANLRFVLLSKIGECVNKEGDYLVSVDKNIVITVINNYLNKHH